MHGKLNDQIFQKKKIGSRVLSFKKVCKKNLFLVCKSSYVFQEQKICKTAKNNAENLSSFLQM